MLEITPNSSRSVTSSIPDYPHAEPPKKRAVAASLAAADDRVELSAAARQHEEDAAAAPILDERIRDLRQRITEGTYVTDDKLDYVVDQLYATLLGNPARVA